MLDEDSDIPQRVAPIVKELKARLHEYIRNSATKAARFRNALDVHVVTRRKREARIAEGEAALAGLAAAIERAETTAQQALDGKQQAARRTHAAKALLATRAAVEKELADALVFDATEHVERVDSARTNTSALFSRINDASAWLRQRFLDASPSGSGARKFFGSSRPNLAAQADKVKRIADDEFSTLIARMNGYSLDEYYPNWSNSFSDDKSRLRQDIRDAAEKTAALSRDLWRKHVARRRRTRSRGDRLRQRRCQPGADRQTAAEGMRQVPLAVGQGQGRPGSRPRAPERRRGNRGPFRHHARPRIPGRAPATAGPARGGEATRRCLAHPAVGCRPRRRTQKNHIILNGTTMKRYENPNDEELQRNIDEQEKAMSALLVRVMERPRTPLHETIQELRSQIAAVQQASVHAAQSIEAGLSEALEGQAKRLNRHVGDVADGVDTLKDELSALASTLEKRYGGQVERDGQMHDKLAQAGEMLVRIDAKADTAGSALDAAARGLGNVSETLAAVREAQGALAERASQKLGGLGERLERQQAQLAGKLSGTAGVLERIDSRAAAAGDSLAASALAFAKIDADLCALREHGQASTDKLGSGVNALAQQLERQQAGLCERIDAVQPALAPHIDSLAASVDKSARDTAACYESLSETQKALVVATVQEQLALQLAPFQTRTTWLAAVCGLSFASTLVLLGMQFIR